MLAPTDATIKGLSDEDVAASRQRHGKNELAAKKFSYLRQIRDTFSEPMVLLLLVAALLYFVSGETGDALFMTAAIFMVTGISWYQEWRSRRALTALRTLTAPTAKVIRNGNTVEIHREDIVIGDYMVVSEGASIPADGIIVQSNDFSVNESILTGESFAVAKNQNSGRNKVFQGTTVTSGLAVCEVGAIGQATELGKIAKGVESMEDEQTPLQKQISNFVKKMAFAGVVVFLAVWAVHFFQSRLWMDSLLKALTLAMSILPEEIPVAFTTFMALGAWRLMKTGVIVKQIKTVETLGSATVICTDKTGTITENRMALAQMYDWSTRELLASDAPQKEGHALIRMAMWASEPIPFDPMEIALHEAYVRTAAKDERPYYRMVHEYPLGGSPPMMTHVFEDASGERIVAAKGAPEAIMKVTNLSAEETATVEKSLQAMAAEGYRVLGIAVSHYGDNDFPKRQQELPFTFLGLVAFYDPPKKNIREVFEAFYRAGIEVKIITGDNPTTTAAIAQQIHFRGAEKTMTGEELVRMDAVQIQERVKEVNIFTRMFPDAKLRILNALKANGEVVAMTGDGVNDGPALKAAHIGVAMGTKGTEIAKEVSSLIISDDDLLRMVDAVAQGRKIYANLKKAIQYIISIHIPIILTVFIPLVLGWVYPAIFTPVHVIFLELIMGPTCSIIYENEPMEKNVMLQRPRPLSNTFFSLHELGTSILQGLVITGATLFIYQIAVAQSATESETRTMVFLTLISANIFLTLVNRSFYFSILTTLRYKNNLVGWIIALTIVLTFLTLAVPSWRDLFEFQAPLARDIVVCILAGALSVLWYEGVKAYKRRRSTIA